MYRNCDLSSWQTHLAGNQTGHGDKLESCVYLLGLWTFVPHRRGLEIYSFFFFFFLMLNRRAWQRLYKVSWLLSISVNYSLNIAVYNRNRHHFIFIAGRVTLMSALWASHVTSYNTMLIKPMLKVESAFVFNISRGISPSRRAQLKELNMRAHYYGYCSHPEVDYFPSMWKYFFQWFTSNHRSACINEPHIMCWSHPETQTRVPCDFSSLLIYISFTFTVSWTFHNSSSCYCLTSQQLVATSTSP